jgi:hypothetical protein
MYETLAKEVYSPGSAACIEGTAEVYPLCHVGKGERQSKTKNFKTPAIK